MNTFLSEVDAIKRTGLNTLVNIEQTGGKTISNINQAVSGLNISAIPMWELVLLGTTGSAMILSSFYLLSQGYFIPFALVVAIAFILYLSWMRINASVSSRPSESTGQQPPSQFTVFRDMEPATQTRVNPWTGFLQEDVYVNRTGPIGDFVGNDDFARKAPLYLVT
jgi:hypothetical protein